MGQIVKVKSALGVIERVLVADLGEVILICRKDEFAAAKREEREPVSVGFWKDDIVDGFDNA